jgi:hypothetical protein
MRHKINIAALLIIITFGVQGCGTLPNVKPFASSTAALATAAGAEYHSVANDVASLKTPRIPNEPYDAFRARRRALQKAKIVFARTDTELDALFASMTEYSEKLTNLEAAGNTGSAAAKSLLDSTKGFAQLASISGMPAGPIANVITTAFKDIGDAFTKMQATHSLRSAVDAAQPAVNLVAREFKVIYSGAMAEANDYIRNTERLQASLAAGPNVIGFNRKVQENYNTYYRLLGKLVTPVNERDPGAAWRGFCQNKSGPCRAREELDAVGLVEARMRAIHPIVEAYEQRIADIDATFARREEESKAVIRAVNAWALEHEKLRQCLKDGTGLSALNLRVAVTQLNNLLAKR